MDKPLKLPEPRIQLNLPRSDIAEEITPKGLIIGEYVVEQVMGRMRLWSLPIPSIERNAGEVFKS